jgi:uncharacterized protein (DUF362 family)
MSHDINRREFLSSTAAFGAGMTALGAGLGTAQDTPGKSRVTKATRDEATKERTVKAPVVREMVDAVVMKLSGKSTPGEAWATYVKPDDVVGIKINTLFGVGACTHPEVTDAVVQGCKAAGVPADRIIVWDMRDGHLQKSGYEVNRDRGVKTYGVNDDWEDEPVAIHTCQGRLAKVLTRTCTALINVPVLKSHSGAGITLSMKNHYGSFDCPGKAHGDNCDPYIAHLNNLPPIKGKTRLIVCDALLPVAEGGPQAREQFTYEQKTVMAATDTVAIDYVALKLLDAQRAKMDLPSLETTGRAKHVLTAAEMGLGVADLAKIEVVEA